MGLGGLASVFRQHGFARRAARDDWRVGGGRTGLRASTEQLDAEDQVEQSTRALGHIDKLAHAAIAIGQRTDPEGVLQAAEPRGHAAKTQPIPHLAQVFRSVVLAGARACQPVAMSWVQAVRGRARRAGAGAQSRSAEIVRVGALEVDHRRAAALCSARSGLLPTEYRRLTALASRPGQVLDHEEQGTAV